MRFPLDIGLFPRAMGEGVGAPLSMNETAGDDALTAFEALDFCSIFSVSLQTKMMRFDVSTAEIQQLEAINPPKTVLLPFVVWKRSSLCFVDGATVVVEIFARF